MCLAVPMEIKEIYANDKGVGEADGINREVNLCLLEDPQKGDYVIVHAGFAIEKLDEKEALERIALFESLAEVMKT